MCTFTHALEVAFSATGPFSPIEAVVDTGTSYSQLPRSIVERLGTSPSEHRQFTLADGRRVSRDVAEVYVRLDGRAHSTICIMGEDDTAPALLGAYTLEGFGLTGDPVNKRLVPTTLYLL